MPKRKAHIPSDLIQRTIDRLGPREDMDDPRTVPDTGTEWCQHCNHLRSMVDGQQQCLLCVIYVALKPSPATKQGVQTNAH